MSNWLTPKRKKLLVILGLITIVLLGTFVRLYNLGNVPVALNQDEAVHAYDGWSLAKTGTDQHGNPPGASFEAFGDWVAPVLTYLMVPIFKVTNLSEATLRLPLAIAGILAIILMFILAAKMTKSRSLAILAALIIATSPWTIHYSRLALPTSLIPCFAIATLTGLVWLFRNTNPKRTNLIIIITSVTAAIWTYTYPTQKLFVPMFYLSALILFFFLKRKLISKKKLFAALMIFALIVAPIFLQSVLQPESNARFNQISLLASSKSFGNFVLSAGKRYVQYFSPEFIFGNGDLDPIHRVPETGFYYNFWVPLFYLAVGFSIYKISKAKFRLTEDNWLNWLILTYLILSPIPASILNDYSHGLRALHMLVIVPLFIIDFLGFLQQGIIKKYLFIGLLAILGVLQMINFVQFSNYYFIVYPEISKGSYQYGVSEAMHYVINNEAKYPTILVDNSINQPYIYYFVYKYGNSNNPEKLTAAEVYKNPPYFNQVTHIGKVQFTAITNTELANAKLLKLVKDEKQTWFQIYESADQKTLIVKKD